MIRHTLLFLLLLVIPCNAELSFFNAVNSSNRLGEQLYLQLKGKEGNFVYSPYSIATLLSVMYFTSGNETKLAFEKSLQFSDNQNIALVQFSRLLKQMKDPRVSIGSSIWIASDEHRNKTEETVNKYFGPLFHNVNFKKDGSGILEEINKWAASQTDGQISQLLNESNINASLNMLLLNLLLFKANWQIPFVDETTEGLFQIDQIKNKKVKMMHATGEFAYSSSERFFLVELPLAIPKGVRKEISFYCLLPKVPEWMLSVEQEFNAKTVLQAARSMEKNFISISLPSFDISELLSLKEPLEAIGLGGAFIASEDFSKIISKRNNGEKKFFHVSPLNVTEFGIDVHDISLRKNEKKKPLKSDIQFEFNRPFLFFAIDKGTGIILLMGRISEP